ncbi:MAG: restriction endonuclease subunit S, partial [Anaerolineales bacterium]|nr:restriction endonuclease subunit S [Anaerolineales bacterium]
YNLLTVQLHARGIKPRKKLLGSEIKTKKQQVVKSSDLIVAEIDAKMGGFGIVPIELDGAIVSSHYFVYEIDETLIDPNYLDHFLRSGIPERDIQQYVKGSTNYAAIRAKHFLLLNIALPSLTEQGRIVAYLDGLQTQVDELWRFQSESERELSALMPSILDRAFKGEL